MTHSYCPISFVLGEDHNHDVHHAWEWFCDWERRTDNERRLILILNPGVPAADKNKIKPPLRLLNISFNILHREGVINRPSCRRCGGSGWWSYRMVCYRCHGTGKEFPKVTDKMLDAAAEWKEASR